MTEFLTAHCVTFSAGNRRLVDEVEFTAGPGCVLAIVGPNGAGKSTLLRLLSGELRPTSGDVLMGGQSVTAMPPGRLAARRAMMVQNSRVVFPFTAFEVVRLGAEGIGVGLTRKDRDRLAFSALTQAGADAFANRSFQTLSGGEQQRVSFARALAQLAAGETIEESRILFLDEPIASLDVRHQLALLGHARELSRTGKILVIVVLHDLALAHTFADRILVLQEGRLVATATDLEPLSRTEIERVFEVSIAGENCHGTPWRLLGDGAPDIVPNVTALPSRISRR